MLAKEEEEKEESLTKLGELGGASNSCFRKLGGVGKGLVGAEHRGKKGERVVEEEVLRVL